MELRQLEYFVLVAEEANFTRGAERAHISQSGVSAQIRQLERDLGAELFDRSSRAVALTAAGQAAIGPARAVLASAAALREAVDEVNGLVRGQLTVGMVTACTVAPLFDALSAFHRAYPGIEITLAEDHSDRLVEQVRSGSADLALIGAAGALPEDVRGQIVISENLVAAVPPGHPLAGRSQVSLAELTGYPVISMPPGTGVRTVFDLACAQDGLRPDIALQASAPSAVADLADRGLGVAIFSATMAANYSGRLTAVPVAGISTPSLLALVWSNSPSLALREFLRYTSEAFPAVARPEAGRATRAGRASALLPRLLEIGPHLIGDLVNLLLGLLEPGFCLVGPLGRTTLPPGRLVIDRRGSRSLEQAHDMSPSAPRRGGAPPIPDGNGSNRAKK